MVFKTVTLEHNNNLIYYVEKKNQLNKKNICF